MSLTAQKREHLRSLVDLARRIDLAHVDRALGRISAEMKRTDDSLLPSPRQLEMLEAMSYGLTYEETAAKFGIGIDTVKEHMKRARERLGALNTNHAIAEAIRRGLIK